MDTLVKKLDTALWGGVCCMIVRASNHRRIGPSPMVQGSLTSLNCWSSRMGGRMADATG